MELAPVELDPRTRDFYVRSLAVLHEAGAPFLVGGAYALTVHAGIERHTKDLDIFVQEHDRAAILGALAAAGYRTEVTFPHWLAKARGDDGFVDIIHSSGNGLARVDAAWFEHAAAGSILGVPVRLSPAEEMIWSKSFVQERERYDGADVAHLLRSRAESLDWDRLLARFGDHWRVLLAHLVLFGFTYPAERDKVPARVLDDLLGRLRAEAAAPGPEGQVCRGTLLSREQYLVDTGVWGYRDARLRPLGPMTPEEVAHWTAAITREE